MKLTDEDVRNIRYARRDGDTVTILSQKYGVHPSTITKLVEGLRRPDAGGPIQPIALKAHQRYSHPKLTPHQVVLIRLKAHAGADRASLVEEFGVSLPCITDIINGRTHIDLPGPRSSKASVRKKYRPAPKLTEEDVVTIRERYAARDGSLASIAAEYSVWPVTIGRIVRGDTHRWAGGPITHRYNKKRK